MYRYLPKTYLKAAVFDLDGVLFDVSERLKKCLKETGIKNLKNAPKAKKNKFWKIFLSPKYMYLDKPNTRLIKHIKELKSNNVKIIIVTGRRKDTQGEYTIKQLKEAEVDYDEIYFRPPNYYMKDFVFKSEILKKLLRKGYEIIEVWDDNVEVIDRIKEFLPYANVIHYKIS